MAWKAILISDSIKSLLKYVIATKLKLLFYDFIMYIIIYNYLNTLLIMKFSDYCIHNHSGWIWLRYLARSNWMACYRSYKLTRYSDVQNTPKKYFENTK